MINYSTTKLSPLVAVVAWLLIGSQAMPADIVLREKVTPVKSVIALGDIADVSGVELAERQRLELTPMWVAPTVGEKRFVTPRQVFDLLVSRGYPAAELNVQGAERVAIGWDKPMPQAAPVKTVRNSTAESTEPRTGFRSTTGSAPAGNPGQLAALTAAQIEQLNAQVTDAAVAYLEQRTGQYGLIEVELSLPNRYAQLLGQRTGEPVFSGGKAPWTGRQTLSLEFATEHGPLRLALPVVAYDTTPLLVAKRPIARGQLITAADVAIETPSREARLPVGGTMLYDLEGALGKEAKRAYRAGDIVTAENCLPPVMVERGALVQVVASGGGIVIRRQAKALGESRYGDIAEVQLLDSRERLVGRVVGPNELATLGSTSPSSTNASRQANGYR